MMDVARPTNHYVASLSYSFYDAETLKKLSRKRISNAHAFDRENNPQDGGLYDLALGHIDGLPHACHTCRMMHKCTGHFGHIELAMPCFNPMTFSALMQVLKNLCTNCFHLRWPLNKVWYIISYNVSVCPLFIIIITIHALLGHHMDVQVETSRPWLVL